MERNLYIVNGRPRLPMRTWRNNAGPGDSMRIASAVVSSSGESSARPISAPAVSSARLVIERNRSVNSQPRTTMAARRRCQRDLSRIERMKSAGPRSGVSPVLTAVEVIRQSRYQFYQLVQHTRTLAHEMP